MESNKDEAARCVKIAESALASGDKQRSLKFIRIARRLDHTLPLDDLAEACEKLDTPKPSARKEEVAADPDRDQPSSSGAANGEQSFTEEHVRLIREIKKTKDYYAILGVEKGCSVEEIRKAYRRLSLRVHPDKNKAPGAEEAFKSVCKAFQCLSDEQSRQNYDQAGGIDDYELAQRHGSVRRRRRTNTMHDFFEEEFDPDEIFRSFFFGTENEMFRAQGAYRTRGTGRQHRDHNVHAGGGNRNGREGSDGTFNCIALLQILPILLFFLLAFFPFSEPQYSLEKTYVYQIPKVTQEHGVEYFVKSEDFEQKYPQGSPARDNLEYNVLRDYKSVLSRNCHMELQRRQWVRNYPTPNCEKLRSLSVA